MAATKKLLLDQIAALQTQLREAQEARDRLRRLNTQIHEVNERHVQERDAAIKSYEAMRHDWSTCNDERIAAIERWHKDAGMAWNAREWWKVRAEAAECDPRDRRDPNP